MSFITIIRPFNCLFVGITVFFGIYFKNNLTPGITESLAAIISAMFIAAAGYVINDFYDVEIDRINKPLRVLPSGRMHLQAAFMYALILFLMGILLSLLISSIYCVFLAIFNSIVLFIYARFWKRSFLLGNLLVAYAAASTFVYGGLSAENIHNSIVIACFAFLFTLLREITKDSEDTKGDKIGGAITLALILGEFKTWIISLLPAVIIITLPLILYYKDYYQNRTLLLMSLLVSLPLIFLMGYIRINKQQRKYALASRWMKIEMIVLLIINWIG